MTQQSGRIACPRCGANNFSGVPACWKCGADLGVSTVARAGSAAPGAPHASQPAWSASTAAAPYMAGVGGRSGADLSADRGWASAVLPAAGDSGAARRAAVALALTLPWVGLPVGWIFMMIEDQRRQAIGRYCAVWSMIGLVLHLLFFYATAAAMAPYLLQALTLMSKQSGAGMPSTGAGGSVP